MRVKSLCWGLCATAVLASAAHAEQPFASFDDSPRFMLYVQKQIGARHHKSIGPAFGFAIERPMYGNAKLLDLRYAPYDGGSLFFNGMQFTGEPVEGLGLESYGGPDRYLWWAAAGLGAVLVGMCATGNDPCDDDDDDDNNTDTTRTPG